MTKPTHAEQPVPDDENVEVPQEACDKATIFHEMAEIVYSADNFTDVYAAICNSATALVTGCDHASLMIRQGSRFITGAASDDTALLIDDLERAYGDGPCIDAIVDEPVQLVPDLDGAGAPWPELTTEIKGRTPVRGMAGFRLLVHDRKAGALNIFSDTPGALDDTSVNDAIVLASFASVALLTVAERHQTTTLRQGLESNREIGKAIGMMMAFHGMSEDQAFDLLRQTSQRMNVKVAEMARRYVQHNKENPTAPPSRPLPPAVG